MPVRMLGTPRLASLEHEGYAAVPMDGADSGGSIEMLRQEGVHRAAAASRGPGAGPGGGDDAGRLLAEGHAGSAAFRSEKT